MAAPVKDTSAMIAGMAPMLDTEVWHFCTSPDVSHAAGALAVFHEAEGCSFVLSHDLAVERGLASDLPMARITLMVHSALDGVGLTAAVAGALAEAGIACNMVAAFHHDHAFVPWEQREVALALLQSLASGEAES